MEVDAFLLDEDFIDLATGWISDGCRLVPDLFYLAANYIEVASLDDLRRYVQARIARQWFIISDEWLRCPLEMRLVERPEGPRYYVRQRCGGPAMSVSVSSRQLSDGRTIVFHGSISIFPTYWDWIEGANVEAPDVLKAFYRDVRQSLKARCVPMRTQKRLFLVSKNALRQGVVLGPPLGDGVNAPA